MPLGPCYVAAYVKKYGYNDVTYYSQDVYHYPEEHLTDYLNENKFDIIGIGFAAGYYQFKKIKSICDAVNKSKNRPYLTLGGHGPTPEPEFFIREMGADAAVMGEGELPFLNLVKALDHGTPLKDVKGIAFKDGDAVIVNERERPIMDLDSIPFPYVEPLPMEYYVNQKLYGMRPTERMIYMISSRGCNYRCNFCLRLEAGIRLRSPENIVEEIKKYKRDYNISFVHFVDELFMVNEKRVRELTEAFMREKLNIKYFCTGRLNIVNQEIIDMMKKSGCTFIDYGIEQYDNRALVAMDKHLTEEDIEKGVKMTQEAGIYVAFNIIFGNLGDTRETLRKSLDFLKKYNDYGQLRVIRPVTPYPGTPLYRHAIKSGLLKGPADFYEKHQNLELLTVNFTSIPDSEFYELMLDANKEIISDYYEHAKVSATEQFRKVYFEKDVDFRGARH